MSASSKPSAPRSKNWLLTKFRNWHIQAGMVVAVFLLIVGFTGIFLNHKPFFMGLVGLEPKREMAKDSTGKEAKEAKQPRENKAATDRAELRLGSALNGLPINFEQAVAVTRERWGDQRIEKIELREERGELLYKIKQKDGPELMISAATGAVTEKGHYEKLGKPGPDGKAARGFDWGKLALDLHTGKIVGDAGKLVMSSAAFIMLTLTLTGIYLWAVPKLRKRQAARATMVKAMLTPKPAMVGAAAVTSVRSAPREEREAALVE